MKRSRLVTLLSIVYSAGQISIICLANETSNITSMYGKQEFEVSLPGNMFNWSNMDQIWLMNHQNVSMRMYEMIKIEDSLAYNMVSRSNMHYFLANITS